MLCMTYFVFYRLNFAIANDQHFAYTFSCEPDQPMAGGSVCSVWDDTFTDVNNP